MGKGSRKDSKNVGQEVNGDGEAKLLISADDKAVDPSLALLFSSSVGASPHIVIKFSRNMC
jgi:hypothetical protein